MKLHYKRCDMVIFTGFFLLTIYAIPLVQSFVEWKDKKSIQALDLAADALITPVQRARKLNELAVALDGYVSTIEKKTENRGALEPSDYPEGLSGIIDDASGVAADVKKTAITVNRHIMLDSSSAEYKAISACQSEFDTMLALCRAKKPGDVFRQKLSGVRLMVDAIKRRYPKQSFFAEAYSDAANLPNLFWDARYLRPYEKDMENTSVFALSARPVMHFLYYSLYRDLGEKAYAGKNGWFFYKPDVQFLSKPYISDPRNFADPSTNVVDPNLLKTNDDPIGKILNFQKQLKARGIDLLVVIAPGKPSIYPDMLGQSSISPSRAGDVSPSKRFIAELCEKGVDVVDLFAPFAEERENDQAAGDSLYLQKDTHWKTRAVRLASSLVARRVKQYSWYVPGVHEYALDSVIVNREGDVGVMSTLPSFKIGELSLSFPLEPTKCYKVFSVERDNSGRETERIPYKDDFSSARILLLGDSFSRIYQTDEPRSAGWIAHLAYELKQPLASIVNDGGASTLVRQSLAKRSSLLKGKRLVIWEFVERDIRFGAEGWKDVAF